MQLSQQLVTVSFGTRPGLFTGRNGLGPNFSPFTVQVTSTQRELYFSRAGKIRTAKRALLSAAKVRQIELLGSAAANGLIMFWFILKIDI